MPAPIPREAPRISMRDLEGRVVVEGSIAGEGWECRVGVNVDMPVVPQSDIF